MYHWASVKTLHNRHLEQHTWLKYWCAYGVDGTRSRYNLIVFRERNDIKNSWIFSEVARQKLTSKAWIQIDCCVLFWLSFHRSAFQYLPIIIFRIGSTFLKLTFERIEFTFIKLTHKSRNTFNTDKLVRVLFVYKYNRIQNPNHANGPKQLVHFYNLFNSRLLFAQRVIAIDTIDKQKRKIKNTNLLFGLQVKNERKGKITFQC